MKKKKTEIEEIIRGILGKDKFLMLNLTLIKSLTPNGACFLTYLLDKYEFLMKSKQISDGEGMFVYRREFTEKLALSNYQQRSIEVLLKSKGLIRVEEERVQGETFNLYFLDLYKLYDFVEEERNPIKKLDPPLKKLEAE